DCDLYKVSELASERLDTLVESGHVEFNLSPEQRLYAIVRELRVKFPNGSRRIREETADSSANPSFRSCTFEQHNIEDLALIKVVALRLEKSTPLLDSGLHYWIVEAGKRYIRTVRFEKILID